MNRLIATSLDQIVGGESLPPSERAGQTRILFLNVMALGWRTYAARLQPYTAADDRIDAVYYSFAPSLLQRALTHRFRVPGTGSFAVMPPTRAIAFAVSRWLQKDLDVRRFDLVHVTSVHSALGAAMLKSRFDFKLSATADMTDALGRRNFSDSLAAKCLFNVSDHAIIGELDAAICLSGAVQKSLVEDYRVPESTTCVVPPCSHEEQLGLPLARGPDGALPRILFVGNDWGRKGGTELVHWHASRWCHIAELHVCSEAPKPSNLGPNVIWHGATSHRRVTNEIMPSCDLFVMPTKEEAYGLVYVEAATAGLPVVGSIMPATPEIVLHGKTGFLYHPADQAGFTGAIDKLLSDVAQRRSMGAAARDHARAYFNPAKNYRRLLDHLVNTAEREG